MDRARGYFAHPGDEIGEKQHCRREMTIGDIDMEDVDVRIDTHQIIGETHKIGRPDGEFSNQAILRKISDPGTDAACRRGSDA